MLNEKELLNGCIAGDRSSQEALYKQFSGKMFGVCLRYCNNRDDAEDVLQEGFVKVFSKIKDFKGNGSFEGWVRRIMVNTAIENFRKKSQLYSVSDYDGLEHKLTYGDALEDLSAKELLTFIQNLSPGYRMVFNLYAIEGYSHKEIAEKLGISEGTSKSQLARARAILQKEVKKNMSTLKEAYA